MISIIRADLYRAKKSRILGIVVFVFFAVGLVFCRKEMPMFQKYINMEPFFAPYFYCYIYCFAFAGIIAVVVGEDFKNGCVANILSRGGNRIKYYFGRLISICCICIFYFVFSILIYTGLRKLFGKCDAVFLRESYLLELSVWFCVMLVQILAVVSIFTMISFTVKKTAIAAGIGMGLIYGHVLLSQIAKVLGFDWLIKILEYAPVEVMESAIKYVIQDRVITVDFIQLIVPGIVVLVFSLAIGTIIFSTTECG